MATAYIGTRMNKIRRAIIPFNQKATEKGEDKESWDKA
jgi:hypothetical protein